MKKSKPIKIKKDHVGLLHKEMGMDPHKPIPSLKLHEALNGADEAERKRIQFALNAKRFKK